MTWHHHRRGAYLPPGIFEREEGQMPEEDKTEAWSAAQVTGLFALLGVLTLACCLGGLAIVHFGNSGGC